MEKKYIALFSHYTQIAAFAEMATAFKKRYGIPVHLWVLGEKDTAFGLSFGAFDKVVNLQPSASQLNSVSNLAEHIEWLKELEKKLGGIILNEELIKDRYFRGQPTIEIYPEDLKERWDYKRVYAYTSFLTKNLYSIFENDPPLLTYHETNSAPYRLCLLIANHFKIKAGIVLDAKMWKDRIYFENGLGLEWQQCKEVYQQYVEHGIPEQTKKIAVERLKELVERMERPGFFLQYNHTKEYSLVNRLSLKRWLKTKKFYSFSNEENWLTNPRHLPKYINSIPNKIKRVNRFRDNKKTYEKLSQRIEDFPSDFALYFLHHQPELTIEETALYYMDQVATVRNIASCLPVGMVLLVKEHKTMPGIRSKHFYHEMKHIPNVILVKDDVHSHELIKKASLIITLTGTIALEGMLYSKPVVILGDIFYNSFGGIKYIKSFAELKALLNSNSLATATEHEKLCMLASIYDCSTPGNAIGTDGLIASEEMYNNALALIYQQIPYNG